MHNYIRLEAVCPAFCAALDDFDRHMLEGDLKSAEAAWMLAVKAARDFRSRVTPFMRAD